MKSHSAFSSRRFVLLPVALLAACAARPAPGISGRWHPVNHFAEVPQEIPLQQAYLFYASPMDATLRGTLLRWARDSRMTLDYRHPSDFTLTTAAARVRTTSLVEAAGRLGAAYAAQQVDIRVEGDRILVQRVQAGGAMPSPPAARLSR